MKKYELLKDDFKTLPDGRKLYRIRALVDVRPSVPAGTLGGYIEDVTNLSGKGEAWVFGEAMVYDTAQICGNAKVGGEAKVYDNAVISDYGVVHDSAEIYGDARIYDEARVFNSAKVHGHAIIKGLSRVFGLSEIYGDAELYAAAKIFNAKIKDTADYQVFYNVGSECGILTVYKTISGEIRVNRGCFWGTFEEFEQAVKRRHGDSKYGRHYAAIIESIKIWFDLD